ncbi:MAG: hypothetical protein KDH97_18695, partial [Calditrichaeota bacterium]|nr:hypothetical protein [Calditrichota bacterium]
DIAFGISGNMSKKIWKLGMLYNSGPGICNDLGAESTLSSQPAIQELRDRAIAGNSIKERVRIDYVTKISNCEKS